MDNNNQQFMNQMPQQNNFNFQMNPMMNPMMNQMFNNNMFYMNQFNQNQQMQPQYNNNNNFGLSDKINVRFKTTYQTITNLVLDKDTTIDEMLTMYLKRVMRPELVNNIEGKIQFLYSASSLFFGDKRTVKEVFMNGIGGDVIVMDTKNMIGA